MNDQLEEFKDWFFKNIPQLGAVPLFHAVHKIEDVTSIIWFRQGEYQVQMFVVPGNYIIPEHTHPNVDSIEVYVGGQIKFSHSGKWAINGKDLQVESVFGTSLLRGNTIRVKPNDLHGGLFGSSGGVFLSIQHWLNGVKPHCVAADYSGIVMGEHHMKSVVCGEPQIKRRLTWRDAASLEDSP
jgi:hypothetical protein